MIVFKNSWHRWTTMFFLLAFGQFNPLVLLGAFIGSMLPDADTPHSGIGKSLPLWVITGRNNHRKHTHSLFFVIVVSAFAYLINHKFGIGILIGTALHIFADSCTPVGLPYALWPIKYNDKHPYFTGELFEKR